MQKLFLDILHAPRELREGLSILLRLRPDRFTHVKSTTKNTLRFESAKKAGFDVRPEAGEIVIRYLGKSEAFRAIGRLLGEFSEKKPLLFSEKPSFKKVGLMLDFSRNGVMTVEAIERMLSLTALMGFNLFMPYIEDTYEVPGEPYWGYLRGRYSATELRRIGKIAAALGFEVLPCIQTLAHSEQVLQWPAFKQVRGSSRHFLPDEEATYTLLTKAIKAVTQALGCKRVHVGMDEVATLWAGAYRKKHPAYVQDGEIFLAHLQRIAKICKQQGLTPVIWGDMPFSLFSKSQGYYDKSVKFPPAFLRRLPKNVEYIYWDYYHPDETHLKFFIDKTRELGTTHAANAVWGFNRLWTHTPYTMGTSETLLNAARDKKVSEVSITAWGDDGQECHHFSGLAALQHFAEWSRTAFPDPQMLRRNFKAICDADFDTWVKVSDLDTMKPLVKNDRENAAITSKWLLWQDPLMPLFDPHLKGQSLKKHYATMARFLEKAATQSAGAKLLEFPALLAKTLVLKCDLGQDIRKAYKKKDRKQLRTIARHTIPALAESLWALREKHQEFWFRDYKPFGWEVLDHRYGGVLARLDSTTQRLLDFAAGKISVIEELEETLLLPYPGQPEGTLPANGNFARMKTSSVNA